MLGFVEAVGVRFDALVAAGVIGVRRWRREGVSRALGSSTNHDVEGNDEDDKNEGGENRDEEKCQLARARFEGQALAPEFWQ